MALKGSRQPKGTGSYYQRSDGRWFYSRTLPNGRRATVSAATQAAVIERAKELDTPLAAGLPIPDRNLTVNGLFDLWLDHKSEELAANTLTLYTVLMRKHLRPALGRKKLVDLTKLDAEHWLTSLNKGTTKRPALALATQQKLRMVLVAALAWAVDHEWLNRNVAKNTRVVSRHGRAESAYLTHDEVLRLREAFAGHRLEPLVLLLVGSGLRRGEALGLAWNDVDLAAGTVNVHRSLTMVDNKPVLSDFVKTDSSVRVASVAPFAIEALRELERSQPIRSLDRSGLVFKSSTGTPLDPHNFLRDFHVVCERAELGSRHPHELRHAFACEMLRQGVPLEVVSRQLGHKSLNITSDLYGHIKPAEMPAMTAALERAFA